MKHLLKFFAVFVTLMLFLSGGSAYSAPDLSGKVVETMNSGGYSYVCLEKGGKKTWVAVTETKVVKGQNMAFKPGVEMVNFESKTLKRKFDRIVFSDGPVTQQEAKAEVTSKGSKAAVTQPAEKIKVEKASGANAYSVADVYKNAKKLHGKAVTVKGKVVKFSTGIMKKNWIHLQDGSGDAKKGSNNLVFTTNDIAAVGDVVTVSGTVFKDKDFGSGYKYAVIVEDAAIKR
ncbi:MAG: OB-fold nucleic acid binding domain-containing protein [Nitrospirae bacterium]|nr:OB-fold nucleic acid binding domain-containing protein [Nitrospirota bacterium]